ncbi:MAG: putative metalloprotease CJM1_0395 family protein [Acidobacteriota bacterium]
MLSIGPAPPETTATQHPHGHPPGAPCALCEAAAAGGTTPGRANSGATSANAEPPGGRSSSAVGVELSPQARESLGRAGTHRSSSGATELGSTTPARSDSEKEPDSRELTDEEQQQVRELKARDAEVRAHEQAHLAAAGHLAMGGPTYDYQNGPDGKRYAVGGEVQIDTSEGRNPEDTLRRAEQVRRAALAPADPSAADRAIAAEATQRAAKARTEIREEKQEEAAASVGTGAEKEPTGQAGSEPREPVRGDGEHDRSFAAAHDRARQAHEQVASDSGSRPDLAVA